MARLVSSSDQGTFVARIEGDASSLGEGLTSVEVALRVSSIKEQLSQGATTVSLTDALLEGIYAIDDEIVRITSGGTLERGLYGTTASQHAAATVVRPVTTSLTFTASDRASIQLPTKKRNLRLRWQKTHAGDPAATGYDPRASDDNNVQRNLLPVVAPSLPQHVGTSEFGVVEAVTKTVTTPFGQWEVQPHTASWAFQTHEDLNDWIEAYQRGHGYLNPHALVPSDPTQLLGKKDVAFDIVGGAPDHALLDDATGTLALRYDSTPLLQLLACQDVVDTVPALSKASLVVGGFENEISEHLDILANQVSALSEGGSLHIGIFFDAAANSSWRNLSSNTSFQLKGTNATTDESVVLLQSTTHTSPQHWIAIHNPLPDGKHSMYPSHVVTDVGEIHMVHHDDGELTLRSASAVVQVDTSTGVTMRDDYDLIMRGQGSRVAEVGLRPESSTQAWVAPNMHSIATASCFVPVSHPPLPAPATRDRFAVLPRSPIRVEDEASGGAPVVGREVRARAPQWSSFVSDDIQISWFSASSPFGPWTAITNATGDTWIPSPSDENRYVQVSATHPDSYDPDAKTGGTFQSEPRRIKGSPAARHVQLSYDDSTGNLTLDLGGIVATDIRWQQAGASEGSFETISTDDLVEQLNIADVPSSASTVRVLVSTTADPYDVAMNGLNLEQLQQTLLLASNVVAVKQAYADAGIVGATRVGGRFQVSYAPHVSLVGSVQADTTYRVDGAGNAITLRNGRLSGAPERAFAAGSTLTLVPEDGGSSVSAVTTSAIVPVRYQWQMSAGGDVFNNISGETTDALNISELHNGMNVRCQISYDTSELSELLHRTKHTIEEFSVSRTRFQIGDDVPQSTYMRLRVAGDTYVDITRVDRTHFDTPVALSDLAVGDDIFIYARSAEASAPPDAILTLGNTEALIYQRTTEEAFLSGETKDSKRSAIILATSGSSYALCLAGSRNRAHVTATTNPFWQTSSSPDTSEGFVVAGNGKLHLFSWDVDSGPSHRSSFSLGDKAVHRLVWLSKTAVAVLTTAGSVLLWKVDAHDSTSATSHEVVSSGGVFLAARTDASLLLGTSTGALRYDIPQRRVEVTDRLRVTTSDETTEDLSVTISRQDTSWGELDVTVARSNASRIAERVQVLTTDETSVMSKNNVPDNCIKKPIFVAEFTMSDIALLLHIGFDAEMERVEITEEPDPVPLLRDVPSDLAETATAALRQGSDVVVERTLKFQKLIVPTAPTFTLRANMRKRPVFVTIAGSFVYDGTNQRSNVDVVYDGTPTTFHEEEVRTGSRVQIIGVGTYVQTSGGLTVTLRNLLRGYPLTVTVGNIVLAQSDAGSTTATANLTFSSSHYIFENSTVQDIPVTIEPKTATVTGIPQNLDREYDGTLVRRNVDTQLTSSDIVEGDDVAVRTRITYQNLVGTGPVTLAHTLVGSDASNYVVTNATVESTATTSPRPVTVDYEQLIFSRTYDGTTPTAFTLETDFVSPQNVLAADRRDVELEMTPIALGRDAGTYTRDLQFHLEGTKAQYYTLQNTALTQREIVVHPLAIRIPDVEFVKTYDGTTSLPTDNPTVQPGDVIDGDTVGLVITRTDGAAFDSSKAGGTTVTGVTASLNNQNYTPSSPIVIRGYIEPLSVTVTVSNIPDTAERAYDGSDQLQLDNPTFSPSPAFVSGDDVEPSLQVQVPNKNVGTYDLTTSLNLTLLDTDTSRTIPPLLVSDPQSDAWATGDPTYDNDRGRVERMSGDAAYGDKVLLFGVAEDEFGFERFTLRGDVSPDLALPRHGTVHIVTPRAYPMRLSEHIDGVDPVTGSASTAGEDDWLVGRSPVHMRFAAADQVPARGDTLAQSYDRPFARLSHDPLSPLEVGDTIDLGDDVAVAITSRFDETSVGWPRDLTYHLGLAATAVQSPTPTSLTVSGHVLPLGAYNTSSPKLGEATSLTLELHTNQRATGVVEQVQEKDSGLLVTTAVAATAPPAPYMGGDFFLISAGTQAQGEIFLLPSVRYVSLTSADATVDVTQSSRGAFGDKIGYTVTRPTAAREVSLSLSVETEGESVTHSVQVVFQNSDDVPLSVRVRSTSATEFVAGVALEGDSGALPTQVSPVDPRYHVLTVQCRGDREQLYYFNETNSNMGGLCRRSSRRSELEAFDAGYPHENTLVLPGTQRPREDRFGASVMFDSDSTLLVGAPGSSRVLQWGADEMYVYDEKPTLHNFGQHVGRSDRHVVIQSGATLSDERVSMQVVTTLERGTGRMIFSSPISGVDVPTGVRQLVTSQHMRFPIDRISTAPIKLDTPGPHSTVSLHAGTRINTNGTGILDRSIAYSSTNLVVKVGIAAGATTLASNTLHVSETQSLPLELIHAAFPGDNHLATLSEKEDGSYSLAPAPRFPLPAGTVLRVWDAERDRSFLQYEGFLHETPALLRNIQTLQDVLLVRKGRDDIVARCTPTLIPVERSGVTTYAPMHAQIPDHPWLENALALDPRLPAGGARCLDVKVYGGMARIYHSDAVLQKLIPTTGQLFHFGSQCVPLDRNLRPVRGNFHPSYSYLILGIETEDDYATFYDRNGQEIVFPTPLTPQVTDAGTYFEFVYRTSPTGVYIYSTIVTGSVLETPSRGLVFPGFALEDMASSFSLTEPTTVVVGSRVGYLANLYVGTEQHISADALPLWGPDFEEIEPGFIFVPHVRYDMSHLKLEQVPIGNDRDGFAYHLVPEKDMGPPRQVEILHEVAPGNLVIAQTPRHDERMAYLANNAHSRQSVVRDMPGASNGYRRVQCEDPRLNQMPHVQFVKEFTTVSPVRTPRFYRDLRVPVLLQPTQNPLEFRATIQVPDDSDLNTLVGGVTEEGHHITAADVNTSRITFRTSPSVDTYIATVTRVRGKTFVFNRATADQRVSRKIGDDPNLAWDDLEFYQLGDGTHERDVGTVEVEGYGTNSHRASFTNHDATHHKQLMENGSIMSVIDFGEDTWGSGPISTARDAELTTSILDTRYIQISLSDDNEQIILTPPLTHMNRDESYTFTVSWSLNPISLTARDENDAHITWYVPNWSTEGRWTDDDDYIRETYIIYVQKDLPANAVAVKISLLEGAAEITHTIPLTTIMSASPISSQSLMNANIIRYRMTDNSDIYAREYLFGKLDSAVDAADTSLRVSGIRYGGGGAEELHTIMRTTMVRIDDEYVVLVPRMVEETESSEMEKRTTVVRGAMGTTASRHSPGTHVYVLGASSLVHLPVEAVDVNDEAYRTVRFDFDRPVNTGTPLDFIDISTRLDDDVFYDRDGVLMGLVEPLTINTQVAVTHPNWQTVARVASFPAGFHVFCDDYEDPQRSGGFFRVGSSPNSPSKTFPLEEVDGHLSLVPAEFPHLRFRIYRTDTHVTIRSISGQPWSEDVKLFAHHERVAGTALTNGSGGRDGQLHVYDNNGAYQRCIRAPYNVTAPTLTRVTTGGGSEEIYLEHPVDLRATAFVRGSTRVLRGMQLRTETGAYRMTLPSGDSEALMSLALVSDAPDDPIYSVAFDAETRADEVVEFVQRTHERYIPTIPSTPLALSFVPGDVSVDASSSYIVAGLDILSATRGTFLCEQPHEVGLVEASMQQVASSHLTSVRTGNAFRELLHFKPFLSTRIALNMASSEIEVGQTVRVVHPMTQLTAAVTADASTLSVLHPYLLMAGMHLQIQDEIVRVQKRIGATVHVERGVEATAPSSHPLGRTVNYLADSEILEKITTDVAPVHDVLRLDIPVQQAFSAGSTVVLNRGYSVETAERLIGADTSCSHWFDGDTLHSVEVLPGNTDYKVVRGAVSKSGFALTLHATTTPLQETYVHVHAEDAFSPTANDPLRVGRELMSLVSQPEGESDVYRVSRTDHQKHAQGDPLFHGDVTWADLQVTGETLEMKQPHGITGNGIVAYRNVLHHIQADGAKKLTLNQTKRFLPDPKHDDNLALLELDTTLSVASSNMVHGLENKQSLVWLEKVDSSAYRWKSYRHHMWRTAQNPEGNIVEVESLSTATYFLCKNMSADDVSLHVEPQLAELLKFGDSLRVDNEWVRVFEVDTASAVVSVIRTQRVSHTKFAPIVRALEDVTATQWSKDKFPLSASRVTAHVGATCDWYTGIYSAGLDTYFSAQSQVQLLEPVNCTLNRSTDGRWMVTSTVLRSQSTVILHLSGTDQVTFRAIQNDTDLIAYLTSDEYFRVSAVQEHMSDASFEVTVDGVRRSTLRKNASGDWIFDSELLGTPLPQGSDIMVRVQIVAKLTNHVEDAFEGLETNSAGSPPFSNHVLRALELWSGPRRHLLKNCPVGATPQIIIDNVFTSDHKVAKLTSRVHPLETTFSVDQVDNLAPGMIVYLSKEQVQIVSVDSGAKTLVVNRGYASSGNWWHLENTPLRHRTLLQPGEKLQVYCTKAQLEARRVSAGDSYDVYGNGSSSRKVVPFADTQEKMTIQSIDDTRTAIEVVRGTDNSMFPEQKEGNLWVGYLHRSIDATETKLFVRDHKPVLEVSQYLDPNVDMPGERLPSGMTFKLGAETLTVADSDNLARIIEVNSNVQLRAGLHLRDHDTNVVIDDPRFSYATHPKKWSYLSGDSHATAAIADTNSDADRKLWRVQIDGVSNPFHHNLGYTNVPNSYESGMEGTGFILMTNVIYVPGEQAWGLSFEEAHAKAFTLPGCVAFSWNKDDFSFWFSDIDLNARYYQNRGNHGMGWQSYIINKRYSEMWVRNGGNLSVGQVIALTPNTTTDEIKITGVEEVTVYDATQGKERSSWKISVTSQDDEETLRWTRRYQIGTRVKVLNSRSLGRLLLRSHPVLANISGALGESSMTPTLTVSGSTRSLYQNMHIYVDQEVMKITHVTETQITVQRDRTRATQHSANAPIYAVNWRQLCIDNATILRSEEYINEYVHIGQQQLRVTNILPHRGITVTRGSNASAHVGHTIMKRPVQLLDAINSEETLIGVDDPSLTGPNMVLEFGSEKMRIERLKFRAKLTMHERTDGSLEHIEMTTVHRPIHVTCETALLGTADVLFRHETASDVPQLRFLMNPTFRKDQLLVFELPNTIPVIDNLVDVTDDDTNTLVVFDDHRSLVHRVTDQAITPPLTGKRKVHTMRAVVETLEEDVSFFLMTESQVLSPFYKSKVAAGGNTATAQVIGGNITVYGTSSGVTVNTKSGTTRVLPDFTHNSPEPWSVVLSENIQSDQRNLRLKYAISLIDGDRFSVGGRVCTVKGQNVMTNVTDLVVPQGRPVRVHVGHVVNVLAGSTNLYEITTGDSQLAAVRVGENLVLVNAPQDTANPTSDEIMASSRGTVTVIASDVFTNKMTVETTMTIDTNMLIIRERQTLTASLPDLGEIILPVDTVQQNQNLYYRDDNNSIQTLQALLVNFGHHMHLLSELPAVQTHTRPVTVKTTTNSSGAITGMTTYGDFALLPTGVYNVSAPSLFSDDTTATVTDAGEITFSSNALRDAFGEDIRFTRRPPSEFLVVKIQLQDTAVKGTMFGGVTPTSSAGDDLVLLSTEAEQVLMPLAAGSIPGPRGRSLSTDGLIRIRNPTFKTMHPVVRVGNESTLTSGDVRFAATEELPAALRLTFVSNTYAKVSSFDASLADGSTLDLYQITKTMQLAEHRILASRTRDSGELMAVGRGPPYVTVAVEYTVTSIFRSSSIIMLSSALVADATGTYRIGDIDVAAVVVGQSGTNTLSLTSTENINVGDTISGTGISGNSTTITDVNPDTNIITISAALTENASGSYIVGTTTVNVSSVGRSGSSKIRLASLDGVNPGEVISGAGIATTSEFSLPFEVDRKVPYTPEFLPLRDADTVFRHVTNLHKSMSNQEIIVPGITVPENTTQLYTSAGEQLDVTNLSSGDLRVERSQKRPNAPDSRLLIRSTDELADAVRLKMKTAHTLDVGDTLRLDGNIGTPHTVLAEHEQDVLIGGAASLTEVPRTVRPAEPKETQLRFDTNKTRLRSDFRHGFGALMGRQLLDDRALVPSRDGMQGIQPTYLVDLASGVHLELPHDEYRASDGMISCRDADRRDVVLHVRPDQLLEKLKYDNNLGWLQDTSFPTISMTYLHEASEHMIVGEHPMGTLVAYDYEGNVLVQRASSDPAMAFALTGTLPRMTLFLRNNETHLQRFGVRERRSLALLGADADNYNVSVAYGTGLSTGKIVKRSVTLAIEDRTIDYSNSATFPGGTRRLQHDDVAPAEIFELTLPAGTLSSAQPGTRTGTFDLQDATPLPADGTSGDITNYDVPTTLELSIDITTRLATGRTLSNANPTHFTSAAPLRLDAAQLRSISIADAWGAQTIELLPDDSGFSTVQLSVLRTNAAALRPASKLLVELDQARTSMDTSLAHAYSLPITIPSHLGGSVLFRRGGTEFDLSQANEYLNATSNDVRSQIKGLVGPMAVDFGNLSSIPTSMEFYGDDIFIRGTGALTPVVARSIHKLRASNGTTTGTATLDLTGTDADDIRSTLDTLECVEGDFRLTLGTVGGNTPVDAGFLGRLLSQHDASRCTFNGSVHLRLDANSASIFTSDKVIFGTNAAITLTIDGTTVNLQMSADTFPREKIVAIHVESGANVTVAYATE